jgi:hypothetical protein
LDQNDRWVNNKGIPFVCNPDTRCLSLLRLHCRSTRLRRVKRGTAAQVLAADPGCQIYRALWRGVCCDNQNPITETCSSCYLAMNFLLITFNLLISNNFKNPLQQVSKHSPIQLNEQAAQPAASPAVIPAGPGSDVAVANSNPPAIVLVSERSCGGGCCTHPPSDASAVLRVARSSQLPQRKEAAERGQGFGEIV